MARLKIMMYFMLFYRLQDVMLSKNSRWMMWELTKYSGTVTSPGTRKQPTTTACAAMWSSPQPKPKPLMKTTHFPTDLQSYDVVNLIQVILTLPFIIFYRVDLQTGAAVREFDIEE